MQLIYLSGSFYASHSNCPELMKKPERPYVCLSVRIDGVLFAIPLRHHISHKYAFFTGDGCGIDYTKAVVISSPSDIAPGRPQIDQREYDALKGHDRLIANGMRKYVALYCKAREHTDNPHYAAILKYSTLQYFEDFI